MRPNNFKLEFVMRKNAIAMSIATLVGGLGFVGAASADVSVVGDAGDHKPEDGSNHGVDSGGVAQAKCGAPPLVSSA